MRYRTGISVFTVTMLAVVLIATVSVRSQIQHLRHDTEEYAAQVALRMETWLDSRLDATGVVYCEREEIGDGRVPASYDQNAQRLVDSLYGYQAINWIDTSGTIVRTTPKAGNEQALGRSVHDHPDLGVRAAIRSASDTREVTRSPATITLFQGMNGFAVYQPVFVDERLHGFVNIVFAMSTVLSEAVASADNLNWNISLREVNETVVSRSGPDPEDYRSRVQSTVSVAFVGPPLTLVVGVPRARYTQIFSGVLQLIALPGFALSVLFGFTSQRMANRRLELADSQRALDQDEKLLLGAQRVGQLGTWEWSLEDNRLTGSESLYQIYGIAPTDSDNFVDQFYELHHPDDRETIESTIRRAIRGEVPYDIHCRVLREDGTIRFIRTRGEVYRDAEDRAKLVLGVTQDVTDFKNMEDERERLATAIEQCDEIVIMADRTGRIYYGNDAAEHRFGASINDGSRRCLCQLLSEWSDSSIDRDAVGELLARGEVWKRRLTRAEPGGELATIEAAISGVYDSDDTVANWIGVMRDVSRERELENQLAHSQKLESLGRLAGGIAHDFNNVLQGIMGYADLGAHQISEQASPDSLRKSFDEIVKNGERGAELVGQILAFARRDVSAPERISVRKLLEEVRALLIRTTPPTVRFDIRISDDCPDTVADYARLFQAVVNLATNAVDATPDRSGVISLSAKRHWQSDDRACRFGQLASQAYALVEVSDDGAGIDPRDVERIFEPFFTTKEIGQGTGMGLSMVLGTVLECDGAIEVDSDGAGTTFSVYLPATPYPPQIRDESTSATGDLAKLDARILVVDDDVSVLRINEEVLRRAGAEVFAFDDPKEALAAVGDHGLQVDLALSDYMMPRMNGGALVRGLRERGLRCPIVIMSGIEVDQSDIGTEALHILTKPVRPQELTQHIAEILERNNPATA